MRLLIANDDGVLAPGIAALQAALASLDGYECQVVAPLYDMSGVSSALTLDRPLHPQRLPNGYLGVNGTPTDCVHLGLNGLLEQTPDMVVAGINLGANLGDDVLYSGTVAAAMEGRFLSRPALAFSLVSRTGEHLASAATLAARIVALHERFDLPPRTVLNVNIPDLPLAAIKGVRLTRLGHRAQAKPPVREINPRGKVGYWISVSGDAVDGGSGTDFHAVQEGYVSVTPLQFDRTFREGFSGLGALSELLT